MRPLTSPVPDPPGHQAERARDVPRTCPCGYQWDPGACRWRRTAAAPGCPWHSGPRRPEEAGQQRNLNGGG